MSILPDAIRRSPLPPLRGEELRSIERPVDGRRTHLGWGLFLRRIVGLDGLRLNDHGRVGFLPVLGLGGDGPCEVAGCSVERYDR